MHNTSAKVSFIDGGAATSSNAFSRHQGYSISSCKDAYSLFHNSQISVLWPCDRALAMLCCIKGAATEPQLQLDQLVVATLPGRKTEARAASDGFAYDDALNQNVSVSVPYEHTSCEGVFRHHIQVHENRSTNLATDCDLSHTMRARLYC